ncbi:glycerophosphoryl diester phosphodiesterase membrane domain-containing protein [Brachybacterium sp. GCM10030252]|uniref:glycerophosphoryl diester phosphodiesterase membrane domain-containing protein n=1 Tax=Brachybacterium sp. GCM10030252 TaxID=3273380 RepID=UPI003615CCFE
MSTGWTAPGTSGSSDQPGPGAPETSEDASHEVPEGANGEAGHPGRPRRELAENVPLFPLRPLSLGEVFGAAVRIYRLRAKTVLGLAAAVYGVAFALTTVLTGAGMVPFIGEMQATMDNPDAAPIGPDASDLVLTVVSSAISGIISMFAASLVTVALTRVAIGEATGEPVSGSQMWSTARRLAVPAIAISALIAVASVLAFSVPLALGALPVLLVQEAGVVTIGAVLLGLALGVLAMIWIWARTILAVPALVVEDAGILGSLRRSFAMTRGRRLWRVLGTGALLYLVYTIALQVVAGVFGFVGGIVYVAILLGSSMQALVVAMTVLTLITMIGSYIATFLLAPFLSAGFAAVYADNRMRHEAWDVELTRRSRENWDTGGMR